jgi:ribonuclease Z
MIRKLMTDGHIVVGDRTVLLDDVSLHRRGQSVAFVMDTRMCDNAVELAATSTS